jgi:hypothetical protein
MPGTWLYHCHVEDHMMTGMIGIYRHAVKSLRSWQRSYWATAARRARQAVEVTTPGSSRPARPRRLVGTTVTRRNVDTRTP